MKLVAGALEMVDRTAEERALGAEVTVDRRTPVVCQPVATARPPGYSLGRRGSLSRVDNSFA